MSDNKTGCLVDPEFFPKKTLDLPMAVIDYDILIEPENTVLLIVDDVTYSLIDDEERPPRQRDMHRHIEDDPPPKMVTAMTRDGRHLDQVERRLPMRTSESGHFVKNRNLRFNESKADQQILYWAHMLDECSV